MFHTPAARKILFIWLAWALILFGYQELVRARYDVRRPDTSVSWTAGETGAKSQNNKPYLLDPFLNTHVSWDSEFYLGVADAGYDNSKIRSIPGPGPGGKVSLSYAFFPLYPYAMKLLAFPLRLFGLAPVPAVIAAGLLLSLLGTLAALFALYDLARDWLGEAGGIRAGFYLLVFPTGFFLAQVYTEGLFVGLAFSALALMRRKKLLLAGLLSALAFWTRAVGLALVVPLVIVLWQSFRERAAGKPLALNTLGALLPWAALAVWRFSPIYTRFTFMEEQFFGRGFILFERTQAAWQAAWYAFTRSFNGPSVVYYGLEIAIVVLGLLASLALLRKMPLVAWFSLAAFAIAFFSGAAQSISRYMLAVPAIFIVLAKLGEHEAFDRSWTLASILLMGMEAALFSYDMWVG